MTKRRKRNAFQQAAKRNPDLLALTFHDLVAENYQPLLLHAHMDAYERHAEGKAEPIHSVDLEPTRYRLALRTAASLGDNWNGGKPAICRPGDGEPNYGGFESMAYNAMRDANRVYVDAVNLAVAGNRVYYLTDALIQRMLATRLDLPVELLRLPFPAFSLSSSSETLVRMILGDSRQHGYHKTMSVNIVISRAIYSNGTPTLMINTRLMYGRRLMETMSAGIELTDGMRITDCLHRFLKLSSAIDPDDVETQMAREGDLNDNWFGTSAEHLYRTLVNTIVYLSMAGAFLSETRRAAPRPQQSGPHTRLPVTYQEAGGPLAPLYVRPADAFQGSRKVRRGARTPIGTRVLVAGHWRTWPGEKRLGDEARIIHIEPYWKGPNDAPAANRPYLAE